MHIGMKHPVPAVAAIIIRDHAILLIRRGTEPGLGKWSVPGGSMEIGETIEEAVKREVLEETGLVIDVGDLAGVSNLIVKQDDTILFHYILLDYFAVVVSGVAVPATDAVECKWVSFDDLGKYDLTSSLVDRLREHNILQVSVRSSLP